MLWFSASSVLTFSKAWLNVTGIVYYSANGRKIYTLVVRRPKKQGLTCQPQLLA